MEKENKGLGASSLREDRATDAPHGAPDGSPPSGSVSTSAGHEEGPWFLDPVDVCECHVLGPSNNFCANVIATVHDTGLAQGRANARLIAAAPDLLEAAEKALEALVGIDRLLHKYGMMQGVECPAIPYLRTAISKATGAA